MSAPSGSPPPSSGGGMSVLAIVLIIAGVVLLACAGICGGCLYVAGKGASEVGKVIQEGVMLGGAYQTALDAASQDSKVVERLGESIERVTEPKRKNIGEFQPAGETFQFDIKGSKGTAIVSAVATAPDKTTPFKVTKITVTFADGSVVDIAPPSEQFDPTAVPKIDTGEPK